jgi:hypothetical protein
VPKIDARGHEQERPIARIHTHTSHTHLEQQRVLQDALHGHVEKVLEGEALLAGRARLLQHLPRK